MTIIDRYLAKEIVKYFILLLVAVVGVYIAVDFIEKVDDFLEHEVPLTRMGVYFILKLPQIVAQISPVSVLLSVLIVFGLMNRHNEIIVLTSSGVSIYTLIKPLAVIGAFFSLFVLVISEVAIPLTAPRLNTLWYQEVKGHPTLALQQNNIWIRDQGSILHIKHYDPREFSVHGITINYLDGDFNLVRRVDALKGTFQSGHWTLSGVMEQVRDPRQGGYRILFHDTKVEPIGLLPQDLEEIVKGSEEMSLLELAAYIDEIEREGYDTTATRVDLYAKTALPPVCIILSILAAGIAVRRRTRENLAVSVATGLFAVFIYWVFYSFSISLGYGGMIPPLLAAWLPNVVFLCLGGLVLLHVE